MPEPSEIELIKLRKEIWVKAVDTQMHFNEMCVKSRQLGLSFVVAALGLAVVLLSREAENVSITFYIWNWKISFHVAGAIVLIAAAGLYAVKTLDLGVYHQMLRGAVAFGEELEKTSIKTPVMQTSLGMTELISLYSRSKKVDRTPGVDGQTQFTPVGPTTAHNKINKFYWSGIAGLLIIAAILLLVFGDVEPVQERQTGERTHATERTDTPPAAAVHEAPSNETGTGK